MAKKNVAQADKSIESKPYSLGYWYRALKDDTKWGAEQLRLATNKHSLAILTGDASLKLEAFMERCAWTYYLNAINHQLKEIKSAFEERHVKIQREITVNDYVELPNGTWKCMSLPLTPPLQMRKNITNKHLTISEIRAKYNITDVIGQRVKLIGNGNRLHGLCPFHDDKRPSLTVYVDQQKWRCFSCNIGGDVIEFVKRINGIDIKEAIKILGG